MLFESTLFRRLASAKCCKQRISGFQREPASFVISFISRLKVELDHRDIAGFPGYIAVSSLWKFEYVKIEKKIENAKTKNKSGNCSDVRQLCCDIRDRGL